MINKIIWTLLIVWNTITLVNGQIYLQLEKVNSSKRIKFKIGDNITYSTKEFPKDWYTDRIESLGFDSEYIGMSNRDVKISDIAAIRTKNNRWLYHSINSFLLSSSVSSTYYFLLTLVQKGKVDYFNLGSIIVPLGIWYLNKTIFQYIKHDLSSKYRLRVIDLNFYRVKEGVQP